MDTLIVSPPSHTGQVMSNQLSTNVKSGGKSKDDKEFMTMRPWLGHNLTICWLSLNCHKLFKAGDFAMGFVLLKKPRRIHKNELIEDLKWTIQWTLRRCVRPMLVIPTPITWVIAAPHFSVKWNTFFSELAYSEDEFNERITRDFDLKGAVYGQFTGDVWLTTTQTGREVFES